MKTIGLARLGILMVISMLAIELPGAVELPAVFSSHMVLQRGEKVPVWGSAVPLEHVTVTFRDQSRSTRADPTGRWRIDLEPLTAGGPDTLKIAATNTVIYEDVLVGDVWLGSGQSNMNQKIEADGYLRRDRVLSAWAANEYPQMRLFLSGTPRGSWWLATPENIRLFSALLFSFGLPLHEELGVPVGLICGAASGTPSLPWLNVRETGRDDAFRGFVHTYTTAFERSFANYERALVQWDTAAAATESRGEAPPRRPARPLRVGHLFEEYLQALVPFAIRGVFWDQGESKTGAMELDQYTVMHALISGWRKGWERPNLPFICVQKPSGGGSAWNPENPLNEQAVDFEPLPSAVPEPSKAWTEPSFFDEHRQLVDESHVALVLSSDLSPGLHPPIKSAYGRRGASVALGMVYGRDITYYGPIYHSHSIDGNKVIVKFRFCGQGLAFRHGGKLQGFALAGEDRRFKWADAEIIGDTVVLSAAEVPQPSAVRYAWANNRAWANLFNKDGLPATPFRTDRW